MTDPTTMRYEFSYTDVATATPKGFALAGEAVDGITEAVAQGIRTGMLSVPTITDVTAREVIESQAEVALP